MARNANKNEKVSDNSMTTIFPKPTIFYLKESVTDNQKGTRFNRKLNSLFKVLINITKIYL